MKKIKSKRKLYKFFSPESMNTFGIARYYSFNRRRLKKMIKRVIKKSIQEQDAVSRKYRPISKLNKNKNSWGNNIKSIGHNLYEVHGGGVYATSSTIFVNRKELDHYTVTLLNEHGFFMDDKLIEFMVSHYYKLE